MALPKHPSSFVSTQTLSIIRKYAFDAEQMHQLHEEQLNVIYDNQLFKMFVPQEFTGLGLALPEILKMEEALAWADGSTGWVVTLCSGAAWFVGFLNQGLSHNIFVDDKVCFAGSGAPTGTADIVDGGYIINGSWKYATGILHATVITANCVIRKNGISLVDEKCLPVIKAFIFYKNEVKLNNSWNSMGMVATASHGFVINDLRVSEMRAFDIVPAASTLRLPIYQYPFHQLAETTLVVNISGMAQQFMDLCQPLFADRMANAINQSIDLISTLQEQQAMLAMSRQEFYEAVELSWSFCKSGEPISDVVIRKVSLTSYQLYQKSISCVDILYPFTGLTGANTATEINRVWRNIHTAGQHALFTIR